MIFLLPNLAEMMTRGSDAIFHVCNSLVGRSKLLDTLLALPMTNQFVKTAIIGGCFFAAWFSPEETQRKRKILLVTLLAAVAVIATTKTLSKSVFLPRPFIQSQKAFHLENDQLVISPRLAIRVPLDEANQKEYRNLLAGDILPNDLGSFPSDHAGFYFTLALGIWLASRKLGWMALGWTLLAVIGSRVISGQHSPIDIASGVGIGSTILLLCHFVLARLLQRPLEGAANWTMRHSALSSVLIFAAVFEAMNSLLNLRDLLRSGATLGKQLFGG